MIHASEPSCSTMHHSQTLFNTAQRLQPRRQPPPPPTIVCNSQQRPGPPRNILQSKRGRALMNGSPTQRLRPADKDDAMLNEIALELAPVEAVNLVQWYPGHIAKAEKELKEQLKAVDVILEVRDGRIPMSTRHPQLPGWCGSKPRLLILNRRDMITDRDAEEWTEFFKEKGRNALWTNGTTGVGIGKVVQRAVGLSVKLNEKRTVRGLRPRPVRAAVVGFPNVGKSALINRLLGRRMADSAPRPGVTRILKWMRIGGDLDLLDAPGIIPVSFKDQQAASRLAMCNDIGSASYVASLVAAMFIKLMLQGSRGSSFQRKVEERYKIMMRDMEPEEYVHAIAERMFNSEPERAGQRILQDFRMGRFGKLSLEDPCDYSHYTDV